MPLFEVDATAVEPEFQKLYSFLFDIDNGAQYGEEMDKPWPTTIFIVNFDKVCLSTVSLESFITWDCCL